MGSNAPGYPEERDLTTRVIKYYNQIIRMNVGPSSGRTGRIG